MISVKKFLSAIVAFPLSGHSKPGITLLIPLIIHYFPLSFKVESRSSTCFRRRFAKKLSLSPAFCKKGEIHA